jgi:gas vesicle protein GvpL/GvpF
VAPRRKTARTVARKGKVKPARAPQPRPPRRNGRGAPGPKRAAAASPASRAEAPAGTRAPSALKAADARGKYVYCIIQSLDPLLFGAIGIGNPPAEVHTVHYKEIAAVVSDTPVEVFDATRENVLAHERVNEAVMREHTVIPMSFGTVFKTRDDIVEMLRAAHDAFGDVLAKMQNKVEFGLKVLWNRDAVIREIEDQDEDVRRLKDEISSQRGSTYFARMQYGRAIDAALETRSEGYVREIFDHLRPVAVASRANKPIGDRMILNAAFLVSRDQETAFDSRVKEIGAHEKLTFKYTGPWPPYNFVNIRLKLDRAEREGPE